MKNTKSIDAMLNAIQAKKPYTDIIGTKNTGSYKYVAQAVYNPNTNVIYTVWKQDLNGFNLGLVTYDTVGPLGLSYISALNKDNKGKEIIVPKSVEEMIFEYYKILMSTLRQPTLIKIKVRNLDNKIVAYTYKTPQELVREWENGDNIPMLDDTLVSLEIKGKQITSVKSVETALKRICKEYNIELQNL